MVEICIVSGFLGAGKTTFIKKLLKVFNDNEKVVVLENEFGEEGIDGHLIKGEGFDVVELEQGCICCSLKINFMEAITNIIDKFNPSYIIVEPTGLGILSEIINILKSEKLKEKCKISSLITIIDSINYIDELEGFGDFFQDQIRSASTLILSKTTEVSLETIDKILYSLKEINKEAYMITEPWDNLQEAILRGLLKGQINGEVTEFKEGMASTIKDIKSISVKVKKEISKEKLQSILEKLKSGYAGQIIRGKGFIKSHDYIFHFDYVNGEYMINRSVESFDTVNLSEDLQELGKACFIGKNLNKNKINILFNGISKGVLR